MSFISFIRQPFTGLIARAVVALSCSLSIAWAAVPVAIDIAEPTYNAHIRPLLTDKCFGCHGAALSEGAEVHLHTRELAIESGSIVPGDSGASEMIKRMLLPKDDNQHMPPKKGHKSPLTEPEIDLLRRWIDQGAVYEDHWSFVPVTDPEPPKAKKDADWVRSPLDAFVLSKMQEVGFEPNPKDGDPHRLIRRLAFDLTGLPPTPEQVQRFTAESTDEVYNEIIGELFASPAYGEHWARIWLDAVRYADTHGIHLDNYRSIWPYRDWVIASYNRNQPFDEFTIEQLAGDMLPDPTFEQKVATGYNRCLPTSSESGQIDAEWAVIYANDRVATTFGVWQGLTAACAACHDHKYDPLTQKEYYQLTAYFRNNTMPIDDGDKEDTPPSILYPTQDQKAELIRLENAERQLRNQYSQASKFAPESIASWLDKTSQNPSGNFTPVLSDTSESVASPSPQALGEAEYITEKTTREVSTDHSIGSDISQGFTFGGWFRAREHNAVGMLWGKVDTDNKAPGWEVLLRPQEIRINFATSRNERINVKPQRDITDKRWHHLYVVLDPSAKKGAQVSVYIDGELAEIKSYKGAVTPSASLANEQPLIFGKRNAQLKGRQELVRNGGFYQKEFQIYDRILSEEEVRQHYARTLIVAATENPRYAQNKELAPMVARLYEMRERPDIFELKKRRDAAARATRDFREDIPVTLVMEERRDREAFAHILDRGAYDAPGEKVAPGTPAMLPAMAEGLSNDRLGLAKWIMSKDNPLTARVTMNRYWYQLFGRGIVETVEDLGTSGDQPSNGPLLDHLASRFMQSDWDVQEMLRYIVNSSTYRQSQSASPEKFAADKENVFLSRGPRYRLDGEQIRDLALHASGLLVDRVGGRPVKPYQPVGVWEDVAMLASNTKVYEEDKGEGLYRRSLYTFWKRTAGHAAMTIFDAPDRDVFCVRRERTNTPLQAFVTLNDVQFFEAARVAGQNAAAIDGDFASRAQHLAQAFISRDFTEQEISQLRSTYDFALEEFTQNQDDARAIITTGHAPAGDGIPEPELAAWTMVASQVLNLDEALTK